MSEITLQALLQLLALLARTRHSTNLVLEKNMVLSFLQKQFEGKTLDKYISNFETFYSRYSFIQEDNMPIIEEEYVLLSEQITADIVKDLTYKHRIYIVVSLLEFSKYLNTFYGENDELDTYFVYLKHISDGFHIPDDIFNDCLFIVTDKFHLFKNKERLLVVCGQQLRFLSEIHIFHKQNFPGHIYAYQFKQGFLLIKYIGSGKLLVDNMVLKSNTVYVFSHLSAIFGENFSPIYFNDLNKHFLSIEKEDLLSFEAKDISYLFKGEKNGIRNFNFSAESNEMIGILGGSGTGKSTLLNLLNGNYKPQQGEVFINGLPYSEFDKFPTGLLGYIPQTDLLVEELTVYQNLYFNTKLSLGNLNEQQIEMGIHEVLEEFDIFDIKDLKVGSAIKKTISGGQRKRLNIAIELIRDPKILFIDEPTSGLSSKDSQRIISILKQRAQRNKIIFVNIHQPSDELFYFFDKLIVIDRGGFLIYSGKPGEALNYFREAVKQVDVIKGKQYLSKPEEILNIIEDTVVDEFGNKTHKRIVMPNEWYTLYQEKLVTSTPQINVPARLPEINYKLPGIISQFNCYFQRNFWSKWSDNQYKILTLTISPVLSLILSLLCKQMVIGEYGEMEYVFSDNENIPSFYFMSVIVAVFVGLIVSAEEIYRDRKLFIRELFLNLSFRSYISSKIVFLLFISSYQTLSYVLLASFILKLSGNLFVFWLTMLSLAFFSNLLGLVISGLLNSLVAIYIIIPLILVPQILLSGVVVKYDKIHPNLASADHVPIIGELMPAKWSYEALIVNQFKNNGYQQGIFNMEKNISRLSYTLYVQIPQLIFLVENLIKTNLQDQDEQYFNDLKTLQIEMEKLSDISTYKFAKNITIESFNTDMQLEILKYLSNFKKLLAVKYDELLDTKDRYLAQKQIEFGSSDAFISSRNINFNKSISELVLNSHEIEAVKRVGNQYIQMTDPIYRTTESKIGRSHLFASTKYLGTMPMDTIIFNNLVITLMSLLLVLVLFNLHTLKVVINKN